MLALAKHKTITLECIYNNVETLPENTLGDRVKKLRLLNNYTIKDLCKKCNLSPETISNIEKNRTKPSIISLNKLSQNLNTSNAYLLNTNNWPENNPGEIIYKYRMKKGLSQRKLAKMCNLHYSTIKDYEDGRISKHQTLEKIYLILGIQ